jgi:HD-like signal output (HDOD) protein/CheY-like chemotaxis protein
MGTILVIDDEPVVREPIAATLRTRDHTVHCAGDGRSVLSLLKQGRPDLILLDVRMPDTDGMSLLRVLRADPATAIIPVILLTNSTEKSIIMQAAKLGIEGYILKSAFSLSELLARIEKILTQTPKSRADSQPSARSQPTGVILQPPSAAQPPVAAAMPKLLTREQTLERLDQVASGKTLAGVVARLIAVSNSPDANLTDVVKVIESDPILAARVLQLANSASARGRGRTRNVEDAARNIGVRGLHDMAVSIGIFATFPPDEHDGFNTMRCWQHSFAVAELLPQLLHKQTPEQENTNHLAGLCHDLGEILLRQHFAAEYAQCLDYASSNGVPIAQVEPAAFGIRHADLVGRLLTRIGLPAGVVEAIREFHERQSCNESGGMAVETQGLLYANLAAHGMLLAASDHELIRPITRAEWRQYSPDRLPPLIDPAGKRTEILTATSVLARLPVGDEQRMVQAVIPRQSKRIWYVRPDQFMEFDPLAFALSLSCDLTISQTMPEAEDWKEIDGVIMVGLRVGAQTIVPDQIQRAMRNAQRPDLPVLALVMQSMPPSTAGSITTRSYPVSLSDLSQWLERLSTAAKSPA